MGVAIRPKFRTVKEYLTFSGTAPDILTYGADIFRSRVVRIKNSIYLFMKIKVQAPPALLNVVNILSHQGSRKFV